MDSDNPIIAQGDFPSNSQPGTVWHAQVWKNGMCLCGCTGFRTRQICRHVIALAPKGLRLKTANINTTPKTK